jgi:cytosine/adenosine deaminase-related metal-dependent hydrolase
MMPEAMSLAYLGHNEANMSRLAVRPSDALAMATREGAVGLGIEREVGSIEVGKRADLVLVRVDDWRYAGISRPLDIFLRLGSCMDVRTVIVGGNVLVREGKCVHIDEELASQAYLAAAQSFAARHQ